MNKKRPREDIIDVVSEHHSPPKKHKTHLFVPFVPCYKEPKTRAIRLIHRYKTGDFYAPFFIESDSPKHIFYTRFLPNDSTNEIPIMRINLASGEISEWEEASRWTERINEALSGYHVPCRRSLRVMSTNGKDRLVYGTMHTADRLVYGAVHTAARNLFYGDFFNESDTTPLICRELGPDENQQRPGMLGSDYCRRISSTWAMSKNMRSVLVSTLSCYTREKVDGYDKNGKYALTLHTKLVSVHAAFALRMEVLFDNCEPMIECVFESRSKDSERLSMYIAMKNDATKMFTFLESRSKQKWHINSIDVPNPMKKLFLYDGQNADMIADVAAEKSWVVRANSVYSGDALTPQARGKDTTMKVLSVHMAHDESLGGQITIFINESHEPEDGPLRFLGLHIATFCVGSARVVARHYVDVQNILGQLSTVSRMIHNVDSIRVVPTHAHGFSVNLFRKRFVHASITTNAAEGYIPDDIDSCTITLDLPRYRDTVFDVAPSAFVDCSFDFFKSLGWG